MNFLFSLAKYIFREIIFIFNFIKNSIKKFSVLFWITLYSFLTPSLDYNFFTCSYLRNEVFSNDEYTFLSLIIYFFYYLFKFFLKNLKTKLKKKLKLKYKYNDNVANYLKLKHIKIKTKKTPILFSIKYFIKRLVLKITYIFSLLGVIDIIFIFIKNKFNNILIYWNPIFKTASIYAFYRSTRIKYTDIKNENFEKIKY